MTGVALHDISTCLVTCQKSFCVTGAVILHRLKHVGGVHVHFAWQGRVVLRVFAGGSVRAASSGDNVQILWQAWGFVTCDGN